MRENPKRLRAVDADELRPVNPANHRKHETESEQRARLDRRAPDHAPEVQRTAEPWSHKLARDVAAAKSKPAEPEKK